MTRGKVDYRHWLMGVFCWDGVLPLVILMAPQITAFMGANQQASEAVAVFTPIIAFFVRLFVGLKRLNAHHCGPIFHRLQCIVFLLAIVFLVCIDTIILILTEMNAQWWTDPDELGGIVLMLSIYFLAMLFAFYPGRTPPEVLERNQSTDVLFPEFAMRQR